MHGTLVDGCEGVNTVFHESSMGSLPWEELEKKIDVLGNYDNLFRDQIDASNIPRLLELEKMLRIVCFDPFPCGVG